MTTAIESTCHECGKGFTLQADEPVTAFARAFVASVLCDGCAEAIEREEERKRHAAARQFRCERAQLPRRYQGRGLADIQPQFGQEAAIEAATTWATTRDAGGLMLTGGVGRGKTLIAAAACWTRLEIGSCTYVSVARAMARLGAAHSDDGRAKAVAAFAGDRAVVLDDLDKSRATDYGREQLFSAVDAREQAGSPLLVTTNLTPSEIGDRYGEPLMSRLAGFCRVVAVTGEDRRMA